VYFHSLNNLHLHLHFSFNKNSFSSNQTQHGFYMILKSTKLYEFFSNHASVIPTISLIYGRKTKYNQLKFETNRMQYGEVERVLGNYHVD